MAAQDVQEGSRDERSDDSLDVRPRPGNHRRSTSKSVERSLFMLTQYAIGATDIPRLLDMGAATIAHTLSLNYVLVAEFVAPDRPFCIHAIAGGDTDAAAQRIWTRPKDVGTRWRFRTPDKGTAPDSGVKRLDVLAHKTGPYAEPREWEIPIPGRSKPFGVLMTGVSERPLNEDQVLFMRSVIDVLAIAIDRMQTQEVVQASGRRIAVAKRQWELTVDGLPQLVCLTDELGTVLRTNRTVETWELGSVTDVKGRGLHDVLHPGCRDTHCNLGHSLQRAWLESLRRGTYEFDVADHAGKRFLRIYIKHLDDIGQTKNGKVSAGAIVIARDVTSQKRAELQRRTAHVQLERCVAERTAELAQTNQRLEQSIQRHLLTEAALRRSEQDLRTLSAQLIDVSEQERKRIALELHDSISQIMTSVKFRLESGLANVDRGKDAEGIDIVRGVIPIMQQAIREVRRISMDLRPSMLDDLGILPAVEWYCREYQDTYRSIRVVENVKVAEADIAEHLKLVIYRVMQEALHNVARHAGASRVQLELKRVRKQLVLRICDNGKGFSQNKRAGTSANNPEGLGLRSMRERVEQTLGVFGIASKIGSGTTIEAVWPLVTA